MSACVMPMDVKPGYTFLLLRSCRLFCHWSSTSSGQSKVLDGVQRAKALGHIDANTCRDFKVWFEKLCKGESNSGQLLEEFKTLVASSPTGFRQLEDYIRHAPFYGQKLKISVTSSDKVVLDMNRSAAISQSVVFEHLTDEIPYAGLDGDEIPVQVSSLVLDRTKSFCNKTHKFNNRFGTDVEQVEGGLEQLKGGLELLKGVLNQLKGTMEQVKGSVDRLMETVNDYKNWTTFFVKSNKPLFSLLHQAADYLQIPALSELTSMAVGDMKESSVEEISEWYEGLSIPRMLSPLGIQALSTLSHLDLISDLFS